MQVAEERGIHAFGQAFDQIKAGPNAQLSAIEDTWGPYYAKRIKMAIDGTWKGGEQSWDGLKDGILTMAPYTNMPDDVKEMAEKTDACMIVMGSQGRTGLAHVLLGSKAEQVVRLAPKPVTIVKAPQE